MQHKRPLGLPLISWLAGGVALCTFGVILVVTFIDAPSSAPVERADRAPDHEPAPVWKESPLPLPEATGIEPPAETGPQGHIQQASQDLDKSQPESEADTHTSELEPLLELPDSDLQQVDIDVEHSLGFQFGDFLEKADLPTYIEENAIRLLTDYVQSILAINRMVEYHGYDIRHAAHHIRALEAELVAEMDRVLPWRVQREWLETWDNRTKNLFQGSAVDLLDKLISSEGAALVLPIYVEEQLQRFPKSPAELIHYSVGIRGQWTGAALSATLERVAQELSEDDYQALEQYMEGFYPEQ